MNGFVFLSIVLALGFLILTAPRALPWLDRAIERLEATRDEVLRGPKVAAPGEQASPSDSR